ncbi:hypothetical protein K2173_003949 [Erythroxylum novogranatense]|uniref:Uncharacterized protein n=1 Tax=Erythroxylum novogranatense TaxID=1862640 RepID=A0AAV8SK30_9ROSI|nr:hypothetical protein K2173_003949 [Erythroxylum novogranatense]
MIPSSNNGNNPISSSDQLAYNRPCFSEIIANSKQEDFLSSFFHFPSHFNLHEDFDLGDHDLFIQERHELLLQSLQAADPAVYDTIDSMVDSKKSDVGELDKICSKKPHQSAEQIPRKRSSKPDRHSKIDTRHGPRDRRIRLSLKVAPNFFDLQEKLNFDKPSKTIEWLLIQAASEIKKLYSGIMNYGCSTVAIESASSTSECEVMSGIDEIFFKRNNISKGKPTPRIVNKEKKARLSCKRGVHFLPRALRDKARERARERTREKMKIRKSSHESMIHYHYQQATDKGLNQLSCLNPFETGEESATHGHLMNPSTDQLVELLRSSQEQNPFRTTIEGSNMIDESLVVMSKWSPSSLFSHLENSGISQENQFTDFQSCKPWELYNGKSLC